MGLANRWKRTSDWCVLKGLHCLQGCSRTAMLRLNRQRGDGRTLPLSCAVCGRWFRILTAGRPFAGPPLCRSCHRVQKQRAAAAPSLMSVQPIVTQLPPAANLSNTAIIEEQAASRQALIALDAMMLVPYSSVSICFFPALSLCPHCPHCLCRQVCRQACPHCPHCLCRC